MATYAYADVHGKIEPLLQKIQETGRPDKVDANWLSRVAPAKSNDPSLRQVLKECRFVDSSGVPLQRWQRLSPQASCSRSPGGRHPRWILRPIRDVSTVHTFRQRMILGASSRQIQRLAMSHVGAWLGPSRRMRSLSDFSRTDNTSARTRKTHPSRGHPIRLSNRRLRTEHPGASQRRPIDLQIHIAPESDAEQIDQIFAEYSDAPV